MVFTTVDALLQRIEQRRRLAEADDGDDLQMCCDLLHVMREELALRADAMAEEWQRYADFFRDSPQPCLITSAEGRVENANIRAAALLQCDLRDLQGAPLVEFIAASHREALRERIAMLNVQAPPSAERRAFQERLAAMGISGIAGEEAWHTLLQPRKGAPLVCLCRARAALSSDRKLLFWTLQPQATAG
jgi:PAS domain-containing protein